MGLCRLKLVEVQKEQVQCGVEHDDHAQQPDQCSQPQVHTPHHQQQQEGEVVGEGGQRGHRYTYRDVWVQSHAHIV